MGMSAMVGAVGDAVGGAAVADTVGAADVARAVAARAVAAGALGGAVGDTEQHFPVFWNTWVMDTKNS